jgi:chaperonin GroES
VDGCVNTLKENEMKLIPLDDKIVVKPDRAEDETPGGIVLPDAAKEKPQRGKVVAVGSGRLLENGTRCPPCVKEGDSVLFGKYVGTEIEVDGEEYKVLSEDEILAKLE